MFLKTVGLEFLHPGNTHAYLPQQSVHLPEGGKMGKNSHQDIEELIGFATDSITTLGKESLAFYGKGSNRMKFDENLVTEAELRPG